MKEAGARKILVVEDDPLIRDLITTVLKTGGYQVVAIGDSTKAVETAREEEPDLVLSDIAMPIMDGYAVLRALQSDPSTARYPVVFITAHREFSERIQAFKFGVVDYVTKPFTREILLRKLERVLDGLDRRSGVVAEEGGTNALESLLEHVQRESRTGVLSLTGESGASHMLIQAGAVVDQSPAHERVATGRAEFHELDPTREQIVFPDPPALPSSAGRLPGFDFLPLPMRSALVVDDNRAFRAFLRDLLHTQGFTVYEATEGVEALKIALERRPWLILTDVNMPGMDGFEFCRQIREHSLLRQTPLIFLSGWDDYKERYRGMEVGADEFVSKQTPVRELLIRIQLVLKRYADLGRPAQRGAGMEGRLDLVGAPGVLQICHIGRLSGRLSIRSGIQAIGVQFREGEIVGAEADGLTGAPAVFRFLSWTRGYFDFAPGDPGAGAALGDSFEQLLLEGCRRLDEDRRTSEAGSETGS